MRSSNRCRLGTDRQKVILTRKCLQVDFLPMFARVVNVLIAEKIGSAVLLHSKIGKRILFAKPC